MSTIFVTNKSDKELIDGYAGVKYTFTPHTTIEIPEDVAHHIFGYGEKNKLPYLTRLGWIKSNNDLESAMELLSKWELSNQKPKMNQSLSPLVERVPLPSNKKVGGKVLDAQT
jgi:hypothetical protein